MFYLTAKPSGVLARRLGPFTSLRLVGPQLLDSLGAVVCEFRRGGWHGAGLDFVEGELTGALEVLLRKKSGGVAPARKFASVELVGRDVRGGRADTLATLDETATSWQADGENWAEVMIQLNDD